jgi:hypothetical protein
LKKKNEIQDLIPPFVFDLLTQENGCRDESIQSSMQCSTATNIGGWELGGWTNTPESWIHVFQARSTGVGARALGEVAVSLFRELTSQKSAAKQFS